VQSQCNMREMDLLVSIVAKECCVTLHLNWPSEVVTRLVLGAKKRGLSLEAYLLEIALAQEPAKEGWDDKHTARLKARQDAARRIRELRKGNCLGPDLTVRDLIDEGRRF
jgi:hypothetical protein